MNRTLRDFSIVVSGMVAITMFCHAAMLRFCPDQAHYGFLFLFPIGIGVVCAVNGGLMFASILATLLFVITHVHDRSVMLFVTTSSLAIWTTAAHGYFPFFPMRLARFFILAQIILLLIVSAMADTTFSFVAACIASAACLVLSIHAALDAKSAKTFPPSR